jgi:beta-D-xylosidase 4
MMAPSQVLLPVALLCLLCAPVASSSNSSCAADTTSIYNASATYLGCYLDRSVSILSAAKLSTIAMTPQFCADWCGERGYPYGGIELCYLSLTRTCCKIRTYARDRQCFCDVKPDFSQATKTNDTSCSSKCVTEPSSACGGGYV